MLFTPHINNMKMSWSVSSSLPWLLMTMTIVGICMTEEMKMMEITEGKYQKYRDTSPFLIPLPKLLNRIFGWPGRLITKGSYPSRRIQVLWIVLIYTGIFMSLSLLWMDLGLRSDKEITAEESRTELSEIMLKLEEAGDSRRGIYALMDEIPAYGTAGTDSLLVLATHKNPVIREFSIMYLGRFKVDEGENLIIHALNDSVKRVRSASIGAAGEIRSVMAVDSLVRMIINPRQNNNMFSMYGALGAIGDPRALPVLAEGLAEGKYYNQISALNAILEIDAGIGLSYAITELSDENVEVRRNAVIVCIQSGDPRAIEPLRSLFEDEDFEVRFYAKQGVKGLIK
jgi:hypothetical protein